MPESVFLIVSQISSCIWDEVYFHFMKVTHIFVKYQLKYIQVKQLCAERFLHDHVKNVYVAAPLFVISLIWLVHRLPCAEERLVSQVQLSVDIAACIAIKSDILREGRIDSM